MQETYTSDFPGMKHRQNIRPQYIRTSTVAGSDMQLNGFHNLSHVHVLHFYSLFDSHFDLLFLFSRLGVELFWTAKHWATCSQSVQQSKGESQEATWPCGFGLYTRHRLLKGWRASLLHWGRASAMFTVMFQSMLRGFKHIKHIYRNTDIGNAMGSHTKGTDILLKTHMPTTLPRALTSDTKINLYFF